MSGRVPHAVSPAHTEAWEAYKQSLPQTLNATLLGQHRMTFEAGWQARGAYEKKHRRIKRRLHKSKI